MTGASAVIGDFIADCDELGHDRDHGRPGGLSGGGGGRFRLLWAGVSTTVVNTVLAAGIVAIPIAGVDLAGGQSAATVVLGIGFAEFGLGAFALYSFAWALTKRATPAATVALAVAGVVAIWFTGPAFLDQLAGRNPF